MNRHLQDTTAFTWRKLNGQDRCLFVYIRFHSQQHVEYNISWLLFARDWCRGHVWCQRICTVFLKNNNLENILFKAKCWWFTSQMNPDDYQGRRLGFHTSGNVKLFLETINSNSKCCWKLLKSLKALREQVHRSCFIKLTGKLFQNNKSSWNNDSRSTSFIFVRTKKKLCTFDFVIISNFWNSLSKGIALCSSLLIVAFFLISFYIIRNVMTRLSDFLLCWRRFLLPSTWLIFLLNLALKRRSLISQRFSQFPTLKDYESFFTNCWSFESLGSKSQPGRHDSGIILSPANFFPFRFRIEKVSTWSTTFHPCSGFFWIF